MKNILRFGINGNMLKTIALIAMVIDHIGFYFEPFLNLNVMLTFRYIGRIAMPIFTYLVVQGFFYTKDLKKYVLRMLGWATLTQVIIYALMVINLIWVRDYTAANYSFEKLNILFIYVISLLIMKIIHEDLIIKKWDYNKNLSLKSIIILFIILLCMFLPIDYNISAPILSVLFYFIERLKIKFLIKTEYIRNSLNKIIKINENYILHGAYVILLFMALTLVIGCLNLNIYSVFAIIPLALYNGERGKKSKILKNFYYYVFPIQHAALYSLAMLIMLT